MKDGNEYLKERLLNSDLAKNLYQKLKMIWDLDNWILGVMFDLKTDEQRLEILKMIEEGETNPNKISVKALKYSGIVGTPIEEVDDNPADILNWDECTEEEKRIITENYQKRLEREAQNKN